MTTATQSLSVTARLAHVTPLRMTLWLCLSAWFFSHLLLHPYAIGLGHDWAYFTHHQTAAYRSYVDYGQLPVWDPWFCGGIPGLGNTQSNAFSFSLLLTPFFGLMPGLRIACWLFFVAGLEGTYQCAVQHGTRGLGALVAAVLFAFCGRFVQPFADGQPVFMGFQLIPWLVLFFERGLRAPRWAVAAGGVVGVVFLEGGAVTAPMLVILLALLLLCHTCLALVRRNGVAWWRPLWTLVLTGSVALLLAAPRLLPVVENLLAHPRLSLMEEKYSLSLLWGMLTATPDRVGYFNAGSAHIGIFAVAAFAVALVRYDRMTWGYLVLVVAFGDLTMGFAKGLGLYEFVQKLPILENIRNPFRFTYFVAFFLALGAGRAVHLLESDLSGLAVSTTWQTHWARLRVPARWGRLATLGLGSLGLVLAVGWAVSQPLRFNHRRLEDLPLRLPALTRDADFRQSLGNRWHAHVWSALNLGSIGCFEEQPFFTSAALRGDLPADEYLLEPDAGSVKRRSWSPHRIELDVELSRETVVAVNQNAHRAWSVNTGAIVTHAGLLAARVPAGHYVLVFEHRDPLVLGGFGVQGVVLLVLGVGFLRRRRRRAAA